MTNAYPHIAARVFDTPLLIERGKLDAILRVLEPRLGIEVAPGEAPVAEQTLAHEAPAHHAEALAAMAIGVERKPEGHWTAAGVAIIPVIGTLIQRSDWMSESSGFTSYAKIERMLHAAMNDAGVQEVVFEVDSPGGEVPGAFDLADRIQGYRGKKRMTAVASEYAASAAYLIASASDELVLPRTGVVGSIGVVAAHFDHSKAMEKRGVAVTYVYAGDRKIDSTPFAPLSEEAKADWQAKVDQIYKLFVDSVARNRGIPAAAVRKTEASIYMGSNALAVGLADRIGTFGDEMNLALERVRSPALLRKTMSAESEASLPSDRQAEQAILGRVQAILNSKHAAGKAKLANHLAFSPEISVDQAEGILANAAPEQRYAPGESPLDRAMRAEGSSGVPSQEWGRSPGLGAQIDHAEIYKRRATQTAAQRDGKPAA